MDDEYFDVVCIKELPDCPMYVRGSTYFTKILNTTSCWVGISTMDGNKIGSHRFDEHFKKINDR